jgi:hypothetical protein
MNEVLIELTLRLAAGKIELSELQAWFAQNTIRKLLTDKLVNN